MALGELAREFLVHLLQRRQGGIGLQPATATGNAFVDQFPHRKHVKRFVQVIGRAVTKRCPRGLERFVAGQHDAFGVGIDRLEFAQDVHPAHVGHLDVEHRRIDGVVAGKRDPFGAAGGNHAIEPIAKHHPQRFARAGLVVHDQQGRFEGLALADFFLDHRVVDTHGSISKYG